MISKSPVCLMRMLLAVVCFVVMGCRASRSDPSRDGVRGVPVDSVLIPEADPFNRADPDNRLEDLGPDMARKIREYAERGTIEVTTQKGMDARLSEVYIKWYRLGYARTYLTGTKDRIEGYYRNHNISKEYRAKLAGWYDGGFAGDLARLADSFRSLRIEKEGGKTGQE